MANRIIDLDKRHINWKKFNNINFAARLPQDRDANGLFDASKWQPRVSGLEGPVTLTEIEENIRMLSLTSAPQPVKQANKR
jgi:hypothetical protein